MWHDISTVTQDDAPFTAWIEPYGVPILKCASVEFDCCLDAAGNVIDANGDPVEYVTHWRVQA